MTDTRKVSIEKERHVVTYAELWHTSLCLLKQGQAHEEGSFHQFMGSLVFTAFSLEAYLNHIGPKLFQVQCWNALERLTPQDKLNVTAEKIGLVIDYGKRPWGIMKELFGFRNDVAYGKSIKVGKVRVVPIGKHESSMQEFEKTAREAFCTRQNAERARKDVEDMVVFLHDKANITDEYPFVAGWQETMATLVENST